MPNEAFHRFELNGKRFVIDPETCFCFECDEITWDVLDYYPHTPVNHIGHVLKAKHDPKELAEVISELEWLRSTQSILPIPTRESLLKQFDVAPGLSRLSLRLPEEGAAEGKARRTWFGPKLPAAGAEPDGLAQDAVAFLLGRSQAQKELRLEFIEQGRVRRPEFVARYCIEALRRAKLAGKTLTVAVRVESIPLDKSPKALENHTVSVALEWTGPEDVEKRLQPLAATGPYPLARLAKMLQPTADGASGRVIVRPDHPDLDGVVQALDEAGFTTIELDLDGAYVAHPDLDPAAMLQGIGQSALYYAQRLLKHHYFRLDPIASLFWRIYNGTPQPRSDPAGTNELAVDRDGAIYPSRLMLGAEAFRVGVLSAGEIDQERLKEFENLGARTTPACIRCWARNLCGGGAAAVHHALSGRYDTPHPPWCDAQRAWIASAISAFNVLSSEGVNFTRVYKSLSRTSSRPSLFAIARAAYRMSIGMRPIEEADAEMLTQWENWTEAAYFLCNETGMLLATKYDREMDSLHPRGIEHEFMLLRKNGDPIGLLKIRPDRVPGAAWAWIYLREEGDYAAEPIRRSFKAILKEAAGQQSVRRLLVPVTPSEPGLAEFLDAVGFAREGVQRDALYLHGAYHDVAICAAALDRL